MKRMRAFGTLNGAQSAPITTILYMLLLFLVKRERERERERERKDRHLGGGYGLPEAGEEHYCPLHPQAQLDVPSCLPQIPREKIE